MRQEPPTVLVTAGHQGSVGTDSGPDSFRMRELHPDNDGGLINQLVWDYCKKAGIRMSRSRPYQKNDNAWVEQRNWTHVRKMVGYQRYDTMPELLLLRELYGYLRLYKNFFQPTMKLQSKTRVKGKIHRQYEPAQNPISGFWPPAS